MFTKKVKRLKRIEAVHRAHTTEPVIGANYFAVGREVDITVQGLGRIQCNQVMLYEVNNGRLLHAACMLFSLRLACLFLL